MCVVVVVIVLMKMMLKCEWWEMYSVCEEMMLEYVVDVNWVEVEKFLVYLLTREGEMNVFFLSLDDVIFVGYLVIDLDFVVGVIGVVNLYGGSAAVASVVNTETRFALDTWGATLFEFVEIFLVE